MQARYITTRAALQLPLFATIDDAFMRIVAEEMLADAYAGINAFGFHAEQFGDTVNKWMDEHFMGKKSEAEMEQLRGPPEGQRFSVDEKSVEALVEKVKTGVYKANEHIDFGFVDQKTIDAIRRIYDFDVTGFKVRLEARQIAHILKDHGENGKTDHSMSDSSNIARMRWAMAEADSIEDAGTTDAYVEFRDGKNRPAKTIIYEKNLGEKSYYVVEAVPNTSKKTLYIVTAFVGPGQYKSNPQQSANAQGPGTTAKTAAVEDSNSIVAEKAKTVKQNFSVDDAEYLRLAENPAQNYDRLNEMVRQAAEDAGYNRLFYHGAKNGGGFTVFKDWQYFTENRNYAARYAQRDTDGSLYETYVKMKKPFDTRDAEARAIFDDARSELGLGEIQDTGLPDWTDGYDLSEYIEENGLDYDGIILDEGGDMVNGQPVSRGLSYVVRDSAQIKSSDVVTYDDSGNIIPLSERFNQQNDDIRFSVNDGEQAAQDEISKGGTAGSRNGSTVQQEVKATYAKNNLRAKVQTIFSIQPGNRSAANAMLNDVADRYLRNGYISEDDRHEAEGAAEGRKPLVAG